MSAAFIVIEGSGSHHCCFEASIVDTRKPTGHPGDKGTVVCEFFERATADSVCAILNDNAMAARHTSVLVVVAMAAAERLRSRGDEHGADKTDERVAGVLGGDQALYSELFQLLAAMSGALQALTFATDGEKFNQDAFAVRHAVRDARAQAVEALALYDAFVKGD